MINVHSAVLIIIYWHRTRCCGLSEYCRGAQTSEYKVRECLNFNAFQFSRTDFISQEVFYWLLNDSSIKHKSLSRKVGHGLSAAEPAFVGSARRDQMHKGELRTTRSSQQAAHVWCGYGAQNTHMPWRKEFSKVLSTLLLPSMHSCVFSFFYLALCLIQ